ncbi:LuxR C-terminal-related transcriptional regulator [Azospirillum largimobile]
MSYIDPVTPSTIYVGATLTAGSGAYHSRGRDITVRLAELTSREVDVLVLLVAGKGSKGIASNLGISFKTVECHRARIMEKLGCSGLFELGRAWEAAVWSNRTKTVMR